MFSPSPYTPETGHLEALERIRSARLQNGSLDLKGLNLLVLPPEIGTLKSLHSLDLRHNHLVSLPPQIGDMTALRILVVSHNKLQSLPAEIGKLQSLQFLDLESNSLAELPEETSRLSSLRSFNLGSNQLSSFPAAVLRLSGLQSLDLNFNNLSVLPSGLSGLIALRVLSLAGNKLSSLPDEIGQMKSVEEIELRNNKLVSLPKTLLDLPNFRKIGLSGNPDLGLPPEMFDRAASPSRGSLAARDIIAACFAFQTSKPQPLRELRLILLGDGAAGKTSLLRQLLLGKSCREGEPKTPGISVSPWKIMAKAQEVKVHAWDFGGQGEMHAAHPYFFGERSLYIIVLKGREDALVERRLDYWLSLVRAYAGPQAQVVIVQTHAAQHVARLPEASLRARHPGIVEDGFRHVECETGEGVVSLKQLLARVIEHMEGVWHPWPASWLAVKSAIAEHQRGEEPILSWEGCGELCRKAGVKDQAEQNTLLSFLHDLGQVVAYPNDARLSSFGVLNPQWISHGVYRLLNTPQLTHQRGLLSMADALHWLSPTSSYPPHRVTMLMEIMAKCDLAFPTLEPGRWIIPSHLDKNSLAVAREYPFRSEDSPLLLDLRYELLPETLITRFIARKHEAALAAGSLWWAYGVILQVGECTVLVDSQPGIKGCIRIHVAGTPTRRREALAVVHHELASLQTSAMLNQMREWVPVPRRPGLAITYKRLLEAEQKGIKVIPVKDEELDEQVDCIVCEMLDGEIIASKGNTYIQVNYNSDAATMIAGPVTGGVVGSLAQSIKRGD